MNKRIKKKLSKRYGYKKYNTYKCIISLITPACNAMGVPLNMVMTPIDKPIRFRHNTYDIKIINQTSESDGKIVPPIMEIEDNNIPIIMPINKEE